MIYKKNRFFVENFSVESLAKNFATPLYCYSYSKLKENINNFKNSFKLLNPLVCFSVKSNNNVKILEEIKKQGCGADVVSMGEMLKALKAGINPKKIVFSGVGKTIEELKFAISKNILLINVESESELFAIERIAKLKKKKIKIGIRLNPNIDAMTIKKISTGRKNDKFGLTQNTFIKLVKYAKFSKFLNLNCLSVHIGSQILSNKPYQKMIKVVDKLIAKSKHHFEFIDLGGGMGIPYTNKKKKLNLKIYNKLVSNLSKKYNSKIIFEPGRVIMGDAGILITKIIYIKKEKNKNFVILDAAMNDFMRPALYGSEHLIIPSIKKKKTNNIIEFVGPICESSDKFLTVKKFQNLKEKDILIICDVGAYGMSLSSNYNTRTNPAEILVKNSKIKIIKKRQKLTTII